MCGRKCASWVALWGKVGYNADTGPGWRGSSHSSTSARNLLLAKRHPPNRATHMAFRGTFDYSLDAKNRLTIPAKFRASLSDGVVLAKAIERCVQVWTPSDFEAYTGSALQGVHPLSADARKLTRFFSANSLDTDLDAAGRVMVPAFLLEHAGLRKEVVVTGAGECLEVWDRGAWTDYNAALSDELPDITAAFGHAG